MTKNPYQPPDLNVSTPKSVLPLWRRWWFLGFVFVLFLLGGARAIRVTRLTLTNSGNEGLVVPLDAIEQQNQRESR